MPDEKNPWQITGSKKIYNNPWIELTEHQVITPGGNNGIYGLVHFHHIAVGVIPLDENYNTWIVGQYRLPLKSYSWEIVEGGGKLDVDPLESAKRELLEETGIQAKNWQKIIDLHLSNSVSDEKAIVFIAKDLSYGQSQPTETEQLQVRKLPFFEIYHMAMEGKITDAISVAAVLKTKLLMDQGKV